MVQVLGLVSGMEDEVLAGGEQTLLGGLSLDEHVVGAQNGDQGTDAIECRLNFKLLSQLHLIRIPIHSNLPVQTMSSGQDEGGRDQTASAERVASGQVGDQTGHVGELHATRLDTPSDTSSPVVGLVQHTRLAHDLHVGRMRGSPLGMLPQGANSGRIHIGVAGGRSQSSDRKEHNREQFHL